MLQNMVVVTYKIARVDASETSHEQNMKTRYYVQLRLMARAFHRVILSDDHSVFEIGLGKPAIIVKYNA